MTPDYAEVVESWLAKARSDLNTARVLLHGSELHLDTGSYLQSPVSSLQISAFQRFSFSVFSPESPHSAFPPRGSEAIPPGQRFLPPSARGCIHGYVTCLQSVVFLQGPADQHNAPRFSELPACHPRWGPWVV